jgi:hypothetical protein
MEAITVPAPPVNIIIPAAHRDAATRYIAAILRRDCVALPGDAFVAARTRELLARFESDYVSLSHGPYARRGADALRIALGKL